ncbi:unnamed protein product [Lymnaea stagnalis]|uniref:Uncharacterized protein n=1 Tax=Lymnaea stagnalis TaxID=6523 RepID=A0AAV2HLX4_LYMST
MTIGTFRCLIFASFVWFSKCQMITLYDFQQEDCKSQCTDGLLTDTDIIVFKCTVDYSDDTQAKRVIFQKKKRFGNRFEFFDDCYIQDDCKNSKYTKGTHVARYIINMTINVEAIQSLSRGQLRGNLYTSDDKHILSSERMIPFISDVGDAKGTLIVNGHTISTIKVCRKNIPTAELNIVFLCESQVSPCLIEISTDDSNETSQGVGHATWNKKYISQTEVNVLIKYGACNLSGKFQTVSCNFNINNVSSTKEISCSNIAIPWTLVAVLAASVVILTSV